MSIVSEIKESFRENGTVIRLIYINVAVFLVVRLVSVVWPNFIYATLAMPTTWSGALTHPWTLFTYMFTHFDLIHILFNMLCLYWFGRIFEQIAGNHLVLRVYLLGGLAGALMCLIGLNLSPVGSFMIGASAAIMALLGAVAALAPNYVVNIIFVGNIL
ncbi:MAG: rhomboid family intramembrane serine protease [Bacteroidales bacterium]|nr:rhomboid family intramembrane serine protease [Bacteroidales bacterium]